MNYRLISIYFIFTFAFLAYPTFCLSEYIEPPGLCRSTVGTTSGTPCPNPLTTTENFVSARSDPGPALGPIDVWNRCRYIDNYSSANLSFFVPFKTEQEWHSFINAFTNNTRSDALTLVTCARPTTVTISPNATCEFPSPVSHNIALGYDRTGNTVSKSVNFTCTVKGLCNIHGCGADQTWTQNATATYLALNSDVDDPSWRLVSISYTGTPPAPNPAPSSCTPTSETRTLACPAGQTGTHVQKRDFTCPAETWSEWYDVTNTCEVTPKTCSSPFGNEGDTYTTNANNCTDNSYLLGIASANFGGGCICRYYVFRGYQYRCTSGTWVPTEAFITFRSWRGSITACLSCPDGGCFGPFVP